MLGNRADRRALVDVGWIRWHPELDQQFFDFCLSRLERGTCFPMIWNAKLERFGLESRLPATVKPLSHDTLDRWKDRLRDQGVQVVG